MADDQPEKAEFIPAEQEASQPANKRNKRSKCCIVFFVVFVILLILIAFVGGYLVRRAVFGACRKSSGGTEDAKLEKLYSEALEGVLPSNLEKELKYFTSIPHIAGSNESHQQAVYVMNRFKEYGFDSAKLKRYNILLSYPVKPGIASLLSGNGSVLHSSAPQEKILEPSENDPRVVSPFNAYSPSGNVQGKLVYANYGREEDFNELAKQGINVTDKVVITRYGGLFRGGKAQNAQVRGAKGLLIYSDPAEVAPEGVNKTYPDYKWLSSDGVQRGNLWMVKGDPLTPGYPATDGIYRVPQESLPFPKIPVLPISWNDATPLLKILTRGKIPDGWQGGLDFQYHIEMDPSDTREVKVDVTNKMEQRPVYDVIGTIKGSEEPDRYIVLGCHRDAWVFGAVDPGSGTVVLMETARMLGELIKKGWRPRRTLVVASWGAEEHGVMGSAEWVEEFEKILGSRAVAYINVDSAVQGNYSFYAKGSPLMDMALFEATKKVPSPHNASETVYDLWKAKLPDKKKENPSVPAIGSGSDYLFFLQRIGIPCVDVRYIDHKPGYPVYHSVHDSFHWLKTFIDPDFRYHSSVTKVMLQLTLNMADAKLVPFDVNRLASSLEIYGKDLEDKNAEILKAKGISLEYFTQAINEFKTSAKEFMAFLVTLDSSKSLQLRMANDQLIQIESSFINSEGLPGRPSMRHLIFAPSIFNLYAGSKFAGITDSIFLAQKNNQTEDWELVKKQISMVVHALRSAVTVLRTGSV